MCCIYSVTIKDTAEDKSKGEKLVQYRESGSAAIFFLPNCYQTSQGKVYFFKRAEAELVHGYIIVFTNIVEKDKIFS